MALNIQPMSRMAFEGEQGLVLKRIGYAVIRDVDLAQGQSGHSKFLSEQGFYPLGHRAGMIVLSYYDPVQQAIIYEKLVFARVIAAREAPAEVGKLGEGHRLILFEE